MDGDGDRGHLQTLDASFVERLLEAFVSLSRGDFDVRLERTGARDPQDTIAYLVNLMAEEIGDLFVARARDRARMEALIGSATDALVKIGAGQFDARVERTFDGSPEDVLAYLVNNAAQEVQELFAEIERKTTMLEQQANEQALAERTALSTLSAGVGHELNNPLAFTAGNLEFVQIELQELLDDGDLGRVPEMLRAIADAREGVTRSARIAADLKRLAPSMQMDLRPCEVETLVNSALALIRNRVVHRARLTCQIEAVPSVLADQGRVGQVLINLVQNALHALPADRSVATNRIEIVAFRRSERMVAIEVRDNGEGIPPENLKRIFESFFTTRPVGQGTGLGLALSKRMIADHGGRIEVESEVDVGSTFRVLLPVAAASP